MKYVLIIPLAFLLPYKQPTKLNATLMPLRIKEVLMQQIEQMPVPMLFLKSRNRL